MALELHTLLPVPREACGIVVESLSQIWRAGGEELGIHPPTHLFRRRIQSNSVAAPVIKLQTHHGFPAALQNHHQVVLPTAHPGKPAAHRPSRWYFYLDRQS
ncbi:hypothetical protein MYCTH_2298010 [Thermothelomyces thermophilus ATCC 42464]|uniref:Uncharacterized protein n=1 Tax=Thermothelomyces thermophilus (strain ATCC 42464 / BCRC 31852 / DSM 1799) TaxID=573729 RepID=G2Q0K9_THET4|nr:uncharacterized protein MYCTH_2298010 [Thermothelomyces thermophilus ATCC 42464]AEO54871.1 hypothetical protein MYCTH_2298010 [Thermothelomyces thermophilus ATCC 42464]